ncbi:MAG: hypothetical protein AAFR16_00500, partial [Pseudomonadota bacterium]
MRTGRAARGTNMTGDRSQPGEADAAAGGGVGTVGALRVGRPIAVNFQGPYRRENPETFRDLRLDMRAVHAESGRVLDIPGFFAADGRAGDSGAASGAVWRAVFAAPAAGRWRLTASFRSGPDVALSDAPESFAPAGRPHGASTTLEILRAEPEAPDLSGQGPVAALEGDAALGGAGAAVFASGARHPFVWPQTPPELLAAQAFFRDVSEASEDRPTFARYGDAWRVGDPSWSGDAADGDPSLSRAAIGALNALAREGATAVAAHPLRVGRGGWACWPWARRPRAGDLSEDLIAGYAFDVSRLDQWGAALAHAARLGLVAHLTLDAGAPPPPEHRAIYRLWAREAVARFGALGGVIFRADAAPELAAWAAALDPYDRPAPPAPAAPRRDATAADAA